MPSSSSAPRPLDGRIVPSTAPRIARFLRQITELLEYDDDETIDSVTDVMALKLDLLHARDAVH